MRSLLVALSALWSIPLAVNCAEAPANAIASAPSKSPYAWHNTAIAASAELITLVCNQCSKSSPEGTYVPLLSVLRDSLGDADERNDRLAELWLLTYGRPTARQRMLSALPFFYWRIGKNSSTNNPVSSSPLLDLTAPHRPMLSAMGRNALQWTMLDRSYLPVRALSRAYRVNELDRERLHLEEALSYLREAPATDGSSGLTSTELNTVVARLELRKKLLGGFVRQHALKEVAERVSVDYERIRSRNWELLRQCADKTGLYFEPLDIAGTHGQYALLWFSPDRSSPVGGTKLKPIWKILNVRDPYRAIPQSMRNGVTFTRDFDDAGNLLPLGTTGIRRERLIPIGAYNLNYPKLPLLMVDFRNPRHIRLHAMTQRSINELTAGVIGISHFTNWYYYVGAALYDFVASRHGIATDQNERLDCYSQFRVKLALDTQLAPDLRQWMQQRVDSLAMNPLESEPESEMNAARVRFEMLQQSARNGQLLKIVDNDRRAELAQSTGVRRDLVLYDMLHVLSMGAYTKRAKPATQNLAEVDSLRRARYQLHFLGGLAGQGTEPEMTWDSSRLKQSVAELQQAMPLVKSKKLHAEASATLARIRDLSQDNSLRSECEMALIAFQSQTPSASAARMALKPSAVHAAIGPP